MPFNASKAQDSISQKGRRKIQSNLHTINITSSVILSYTEPIDQPIPTPLSPTQPHSSPALNRPCYFTVPSFSKQPPIFHLTANSPPQAHSPLHPHYKSPRTQPCLPSPSSPPKASSQSSPHYTPTDAPWPPHPHANSPSPRPIPTISYSPTQPH